MQFIKSIFTILNQKERVRLLLLTFFDIIISGLDIVFLGLTVLIINFYSKSASFPYNALLPSNLTNRNSILLIALFFVLFGIKNLIAYWLTASKYKFIYSVASRLSEYGIRKYLKDDYLNYVKVDSSSHIRKISQQPIEFSHYILTNFQQIISQSTLVLFTIIAILLYNATLFLLLLVLLLPVVVLLAWLLKRRLKHIRESIKQTSEETLKNLNEALNSYIESNVYHKDEFFAYRYYQQQQKLNDNICSQQTIQSLPSRMIEVFAVLGFLILIVVNKWSTDTPIIDLLTIGVFMAAAYKIIPGMVKILNSAGQIKTYEFILNDMQAISNANIVNRPPLVANIQSISFKNVCFKYDENIVLKDVNFTIFPTDFIGISANSGRGKTTLMHTLLGFVEQQQGVICINDSVTTATDRRNYQRRISYIKQQPFFIHDTVLKNITLQDIDEYDSTKLQEVMEFCNLDNLLEKHTEGVNLIITENGKNLSGGQRQRIMLARALYHDCDLLILDEPFAELDDKSERDILINLQKLAAMGKMILFITHKKDSLSFCTKTLFLDE